MSQICYKCGKKPQTGNNVSHAHNKSRRRFNPNLQSVRSVENGQVKRIKVCTRCLRTGLVAKPAN